MNTITETSTKIKITTPNLYAVILLNDDYTPMDFVTEILMDVFAKNIMDAQDLTMEIHTKGRGIAGVFTREVANQKIIDVELLASHYGHPLKAITEKLE